jgi:threonine aldolase
VAIDPAEVRTNIVVFKVADAPAAEALVAAARQSGLLLSSFGGGRVRAVTRYGVTAEDCREAVAVLRRIQPAVQS